MSHCSDCPEIATHKCLVCNSSFCEACAKRHLAFYANPNAAILIKLEPTDAKTL
jgi:hypothetical protein